MLNKMNKILDFFRTHWVSYGALQEFVKTHDALSCVIFLAKGIAINGEQTPCRARGDFPQIHVQLRILG